MFETGARRAVGTVRGTNSSKSIEKLLGIDNKQKGVCKFKCPEGEPSISIRFDPNGELDESSGSDKEGGENQQEKTDDNDADSCGDLHKKQGE